VAQVVTLANLKKSLGLSNTGLLVILPLLQSLDVPPNSQVYCSHASNGFSI